MCKTITRWWSSRMSLAFGHIVDPLLILIDDLNEPGDGLLLALQVAAQLCQLEPQRIVFIKQVLVFGVGRAP
jgi:hypothetical protein